jgi:hypothetical protein
MFVRNRSFDSICEGFGGFKAITDAEISAPLVVALGENSLASSPMSLKSSSTESSSFTYFILICFIGCAAATCDAEFFSWQEDARTVTPSCCPTR